MALNHIKPGMITSTKNFLKHIASIEVIPPSNGEFYIPANNTFHVGNGKLVRLSERQRNLAVIMATDSKITNIDAIVKAGYDVKSGLWDKNTKASTMKDNFRQKFTGAYTEGVQHLQHHIQQDACEALNIDAAWVLGQQVALFEEVKRKGHYTQAVRLLHDISYHVDIDARVSNKLEISEKVDYAALLQQADARTQSPTIERTKTSPSLDDKSKQGGIPSLDSPEIVEGEFEEIEVGDPVTH